ncbi:hypothetical protein CAI21_20140 [Alkalilimnicola ehrlichii]|uniref:DUF444 family protein n=1 Tax=Alkalilimnicola ehrlichii TaxID=351052 RepID=A0A3E0WIR2_9GAMM|nr:DUF444 family protein [Alkalilimnicola ehrlichii]RFA24783.1 hypothetical protein CAI21_20140 [Alkalilimnicola ehrlichii]RFA32041.1 hypothetical protein CAL65_20595 [Alkalilimnicola ehrlichii]
MSLSETLAGEQGNRWYDLFSRGTRDWLRHNEKVREAVRDALPNLVGKSDILSRPDNRTVQVPFRMMEHYRFQLLKPSRRSGAGQGKVEPGDVLVPGQGPQRPARGSEGEGGNEEGGPQFLLEFQVDDILDWLWEELELPNLQPRDGAEIETMDYRREGWDKRGARSRLDRRRTVKEAVKRRSVAGQSATPFTNDDLRFRQLVRRPQPSTRAVVFFLLDVSSSMDDACRKLAKSFFFWALQGIRRQFTHIETVFIAHTVQAWEFDESQFFQVRGEGGTKASSALRKALDVFDERYDNSRYNSYLFYAGDGENFFDDREASRLALSKLAETMSFLGYAEVASVRARQLNTEMAALFHALVSRGVAAGSYSISREEDIWPAIKSFFTDQTAEAS